MNDSDFICEECNALQDEDLTCSCSNCDCRLCNKCITDNDNCCPKCNTEWE